MAELSKKVAVQGDGPLLTTVNSLTRLAGFESVDTQATKMGNIGAIAQITIRENKDAEQLVTVKGSQNGLPHIFVGPPNSGCDVELPGGEATLVGILEALGRGHSRATVVALAAMGGAVGATTTAIGLAYALAQLTQSPENRRKTPDRKRKSRRRENTLTAIQHPLVVLVDLNPAGGGIDVPCGLTEKPGPRWEDLGDSAPLPVRLLDGLPKLGNVAVLSHGRPAQKHTNPAATIEALTQVVDYVVVTGNAFDIAENINVDLWVKVSGRGLRCAAAALARSEEKEPTILAVTGKGDPTRLELEEATGAHTSIQLPPPPSRGADSSISSYLGRKNRWWKAILWIATQLENMNLEQKSGQVRNYA